jgi:geranylgeranyl diphosphate synthase type II
MRKKSSLYDFLKDSFNQNLSEYFKTLEGTVNENLLEAMKYSIFNTGKRLRPVLCMLGARFAGGNENDAMTFAMAVEMIHTYSLVHDDLPGIDNDTIRRGKMTTHVMHGEGIAVLAGDALLNLAYEMMTEETLKENNPKKLRAMNLIMKCAGCKGMLNGQAKDIDHEISKSYLLEHILAMYREKTSDLIRASLVSGAMIKGAPKEQLEALSLFADYFGVYFQIQDDLFDLERPIEPEAQQDKETQDEQVGSIANLFGMEAKSEATEAAPASQPRTTLVKFLGVEETKNVSEQYEKFIYEALEPYSERAKELLELFESMKNRSE